MARRAGAIVRRSGAFKGTAPATKMSEHATHARAYFVKTPMGFVSHVSLL